MADEADASDDTIQRLIDAGIARARMASERSLPSIGVYHNCESPVGSGRIFCSKECSDDYEAIAAARKRNGQ